MSKESSGGNKVGIRGSRGDIGRAAIAVFCQDNSGHPGTLAALSTRESNLWPSGSATSEEGWDRHPKYPDLGLGLKLDNEGNLLFGGRPVNKLVSRGPDTLWPADVNTILDATGEFKYPDSAQQGYGDFLDHDGRVAILTGPFGSDPNRRGLTIVCGYNDTPENIANIFQKRVIAVSSCTTNATLPILAGLLDYLEEVNITPNFATINTTHARTNSNDPEAIKGNMIVSGSGATEELRLLDRRVAKLVIPPVTSIRVDVDTGSIADLTLFFNQDSIEISREGIENYLRDLMKVGKLKGVSQFAKDMPEGTRKRNILDDVVLTDTSSVILGIETGQGYIKIQIGYDNIMGYTSVIVNRLLVSISEHRRKRPEVDS
ncbi:hypothetical protein KA531_00185 [Candidatus Saccharibacteria bacterium]|nr:hypothetical protein [Candidatus Saccharibacteria bacterium]